MSLDEINSEVVEQLKASEKLRGPIDKVVLSADGKTLVDGHQRKAADPDWPEEINPKLVTEEDCILFDIDKNWNRTSKSEAWKHSRIERLARLGNSVQDIIRKTGFKEWKVYHYYPDDLKDQAKADAGRVGGPAASVVRVTTQIAEEELRKAEDKARGLLIECHNCKLGFRTDEIKYINERPYCLRCAPQAHIAFEREKKKAAQEEKPLSSKSLDTYEEKMARMKVHDSQFQQDVFVELANEGYLFEQNVKLPVVETEPDGLERTLNLLVYLDNVETHKHNQLDKDERLRELFKKHHPEVTILPIAYTGKSDKEKARVKGLIREKCDFLKEELAKWPELNDTLPSASDNQEEES